MSVRSKADTARRDLDLRYGPEADIGSSIDYFVSESTFCCFKRFPVFRLIRELYRGNSSGSFATLAAIRRASSRVRLAHWVTDLV
jgi:hypothetical protein